MPGRSRVAASCVVAIAALWLGAAGCGQGAPPRPADPELATGQRIYLQHCAPCHGRSGGGGTGPALGGGRVVRRYPDAAEHRAVVERGRRAMPAWRGVLSADEIEAVVRYEREALGR